MTSYRHACQRTFSPPPRTTWPAPGPRNLHEVKTGEPGHKESYLKQCDQDRHLLDTGQVDNALWHFLPHANASQGIPQDLLDCLRRNRIPFTIHASDGSFWP